MKWQDVLFSVSALVFSAALVPLTRRTASVPRRTSVTTSVTLYAIAYAEFTLSLPLAAALTLVQASTWGFIAWRRAWAR